MCSNCEVFYYFSNNNIIIDGINNCNKSMYLLPDPETPSNGKATSDMLYITVTWNAVNGGLDKYVVTYSGEGITGTKKVDVDKHTTTYNVPGLNGGHKYTITIFAESNNIRSDGWLIQDVITSEFVYFVVLFMVSVWHSPAT